MLTISPRKTALAAIVLSALLLAGCGDQKKETAAPATEGPSFSTAMQQAQGDQMSNIPAGSAKAVTPFADLDVEKAEGENSYKVGDIFAKGSELNGQTVRVRGQVVKFSPAIMNRNFIHLQDGSGNQDEATHNLVATSEETVQLGDIVTVEGVLAADKDFGAGYVYRVIIEESRVIE